VKESTRVLLALVVALAAGAAIAAWGDARGLAFADALAPIGTVWINGIRMTVIPLVVSLLVTAVASASDLRSIGRLGGRTVVVFLLLLTLVAVTFMAVVPLLFDRALAGLPRPALPEGATAAASEIAASGQSAGTVAWLVSLLPPNPIGAAASGALVPLMVFSLLFGLAIARSSPATRETLVGFFRALGESMLVLVRWVILLAPIGIVGLVLPLAAHAGLALVGGIGVYVVAYSLSCLLMVALHYPVAVLFGRIPLRRFARALLPAQLIAFSSSSSIAGLPALVQGAERDLELPPRVAGFVLPLAVSVFHVSAPVSWPIGALFVSWFYGVPLHAPQLATLAFASVFFAFAGPGVPRGAFLMLAPLLGAVGLPLEGIGLLIAVDALPDVFSTVLNVTGDFTATVLVARGEPEEAAP
jgi:Na+/H+-dicarboxylate symporter